MRSLLPLSIVLLAASTAASAQTYTVIHHFGSKPGDPLRPGAWPGTIAQGRGGSMYTTGWGGGDAFRTWPGGDVQNLHQFGARSALTSGLTLAVDGQYYGTTGQGGTPRQGTIFKMSQKGQVTTLHQFQGGTDGAFPVAAPVQGAKGDFFGTAGGASYASVYRITKDGNFTLLHGSTGNDGVSPQGPLVQGTDYLFYGTMCQGGAEGDGTVFRVDSTGEYKVLVSFNGTNGNCPLSGLIQATDGNFYGLTFNGGPSDIGVFFRMNPNGDITVLHYFTGGSDGSYPSGELVQASDGNLYGTTSGGGRYRQGVLFRATLTGNLVPLHNFIQSSGVLAYPGLFQHTNGKLYGYTGGGGKFGKGVFYSMDAGLPPFVSYLPTYGRPGALVQILGQGFTADSKVSFKGTPATSPVVVYPTYIRVIVPAGATTGPITVTTSSGTLTSNTVFVVHSN